MYILFGRGRGREEKKKGKKKDRQIFFSSNPISKENEDKEINKSNIENPNRIVGIERTVSLEFSFEFPLSLSPFNLSIHLSISFSLTH